MNWHSLLVKHDNTIMQTMQIIDNNGSKFVLVVNDEMKLLGVVTDGNIRRGFLRGLSTEDPVISIATLTPFCVSSDTTYSEALSIMIKSDYTHLPLVDEQGTLLNVLSLNELQNKGLYSNPVVIMAGGLGTRLGELTQSCPKPMLHVGGQPILELILKGLIDCGFNNFFFSVNYKAEMIKQHFKDGSSHNVSIRYLHEDTRLGTAGALSLLPPDINEAVLTMNGDILARLDYGKFLNFHKNSGGVASIAVKQYETIIPYGVILSKDEDNEFIAIDEKPTLKYLISAGIHVLSPELLKLIPHNQYLDMPTLINKAKEKNKKIYTYLLEDYWIDIGHVPDYHQAIEDVNNSKI